MNSLEGVFDPENVTLESMQHLAEHLQEFLDVKREITVIPPDLERIGHGVNHQESYKLVEELIRKLNKGKTSVFKDIDDDY